MDNKLSKYLKKNGVIFEANRTLFHPLGLNLSINTEGALDMTKCNNKDGICYDEKELVEVSPVIETMIENFKLISETKHSARKAKLGSVIQKLPKGTSPKKKRKL